MDIISLKRHAESPPDPPPPQKKEMWSSNGPRAAFLTPLYLHVQHGEKYYLSFAWKNAETHVIIFPHVKTTTIILYIMPAWWMFPLIWKTARRIQHNHACLSLHYGTRMITDESSECLWQACARARRHCHVLACVACASGNGQDSGRPLFLL